MENEIENKIYEFSKGFRQISATLIMRKFQLTYETAYHICCKIWLKNHNEAQQMAKNFREGS